MARGHGPHYSTASSTGLVTGADTATWAGRGVIVLLWDLALVVPLPVFALGPGPLVPKSWVNWCAIELGVRGVRGGQSRGWAATGEVHFFQLFFWGFWGGKLLGRMAAYSCAPLPFPWFLALFPVVLLVFGHLAPWAGLRCQISD